MFLGFYNYTVWLTYFSLVSGILGIIVLLSGGGHPYLGTFFLLFLGLCDAYDGKVARMKKVRIEEEKAFGIQIDFLADMVAFGVLPACIGELCLASPNLEHSDRRPDKPQPKLDTYTPPGIAPQKRRVGRA